MMLMIVIPSVLSVSVVAEDDHNIVEYLAPQPSQVLSFPSSKFSEDFKIRDIGLEPFMKTGNKLLHYMKEKVGISSNPENKVVSSKSSSSDIPIEEKRLPSANIPNPSSGKLNYSKLKNDSDLLSVTYGLHLVHRKNKHHI